MRWRLVIAAGTCIVVFGGAARATQEAPAPPQDSPYVGAEACQECHADNYTAWHATKHASALNRLNAADRAGGQCIRCHATGSPEQLAAEGANPSLPGVQCEACHGAGRAHADAARAGTPQAGAIAKAPGEKNCLGCHNEQSPHYTPFFFSAMKGLVHRR